MSCAALPRITTQADGTRWVAYLDRTGAVKREQIHQINRDWQEIETRRGTTNHSDSHHGF